MIRGFVWVLVCLLVTLPGCSSDSSLLPSGEDLGSFADVGDPESYGSATLYTYMNGGAEVFLEYGFVALSIRRYSRGSDQLIAELFEMRDPSAAASLYSYLRRTNAETEIRPGCRASVTPSEVLLAKGRYYLACRNEDPLATRGVAVGELAERIADRLAGDSPSGLFDPIRMGNPVPGSEIFIAGPISLRVRPWLAPIGERGFERGWLAAFQTLSARPVEALVADYQTAALAREAVAGVTASSHPELKVESRGRRAVVVNDSTTVAPQHLIALMESLLTH